MKRRISIIIPVYNEADNVEAMHGRLHQLFSAELVDYEMELIFSDNSSADGTFDRIRLLSECDPRVRGIRLSRNFGFQANILSGMMNATGHCVVQLDADGEDPPELIPAFVAKWEEGFDVVYGIRKIRREGAGITLLRKLFYRLLRGLSVVDLPLDAGDFRLIDRRIAELIRDRFEERSLYLRGLISYAGFKQTGIPYVRGGRAGGASKFNLWSYGSLALDAFVSFSRVPLRLMSCMGLLVSLLSFTGMLAYLVLYVTGHIPVRGFATLILVVLFLAGIQLLSLGVVAEYIGRIFDEVKRRPRTIIAEYCGFTDKPREA